MRTGCYGVLCLYGAMIGGCAATGAMYQASPGSGDLARQQLAEATPASPAPDPAGEPVLASAATPASATTPAPAQRLIVYNAALNIVVADIARALDSVRSSAERLGGYLQEQDANSITVRIPALRFQEALSLFENLGEVTQRHVKAQDITEEMRDLKIRLENAEQVRQRLAALLEKSQKMEDTLKIEAELERVTQTVELLKGKIQYLSSQVAFSTLRVQFNSPLPQKQMVAALPFQWVRQLGDGLVTGSAQASPDTSIWRSKVVNVDLPPGYVLYYSRDGLAEAMNAEGLLLKLQRHDNYRGGDVAFWHKLARRSLLENRALHITRESDLALDKDNKAKLILGTRDLAGQPSSYLLALAVTDKRVYTLEAWGPQDAFNRDLPTLERALRTIRP